MEKILWGFVGSIVTILVTKIFEIYKNHRDNKFSLQKMYFEKKLNAAEEAISDLYEEITGISLYIRVYEKLAKSDIEKIPFIFKELEIFSKDTKNALEASRKIANRMYLYFDFDEYLEKVDSDLNTLLNISIEIRSLDSEMETKSKNIKGIF